MDGDRSRAIVVHGILRARYMSSCGRLLADDDENIIRGLLMKKPPLKSLYLFQAQVIEELKMF